MESDVRYYWRRAAMEAAAAARAITPEARLRRQLLATQFASKARACETATIVPLELNQVAAA